MFSRYVEMLIFTCGSSLMNHGWLNTSLQEGLFSGSYVSILSIKSLASLEISDQILDLKLNLPFLILAMTSLRLAP